MLTVWGLAQYQHKFVKHNQLVIEQYRQEKKLTPVSVVYEKTNSLLPLPLVLRASGVSPDDVLRVYARCCAITICMHASMNPCKSCKMLLDLALQAQS